MLLKRSIIEMRAEEASQADFRNKKYDNLTDKVCEVEEKIKGLVSEDKQHELYNLMMEHESATIQSSVIEQKEMYRQGFNDGLEIAARLLKVRI